jgi:hypothetical protein
MEFLLEAYAATAAAAESDADRMRASAARSTEAGNRVQVLRTIYLPEDETSLVLLEATTAADARGAVMDAGLPVDRIVVAVLQPESDSCA